MCGRVTSADYYSMVVEGSSGDKIYSNTFHPQNFKMFVNKYALCCYLCYVLQISNISLFM